MFRLLLFSFLHFVVAADAHSQPPVSQAPIRPFVRRLGSITDERGRVVYHVVAKRWTVPAALVTHGHSAVFFHNRQWVQVARYEVGLPEDLPVQLANNTLYFTYTGQHAAKQKHNQALGTSLPKMLCVAPDDCYPRE